MARWIQELGTYEFQVIHCRGKHHSNANGLSRVPCKQCGRMDEMGVEGPPGLVATVLWGAEGWSDVIQCQARDSCISL